QASVPAAGLPQAPLIAPRYGSFNSAAPPSWVKLVPPSVEISRKPPSKQAVVPLFSMFRQFWNFRVSGRSLAGRFTVGEVNRWSETAGRLTASTALPPDSGLGRTVDSAQLPPELPAVEKPFRPVVKSSVRTL